MQSLKSGLRICAAAAFAVLAIQGGYARGGGPFTPLAGNWLGSGTIDTPSGSSERIRCRATYAVSPGGDTLTQMLLCASDSYQVDIDANLTEQGGAVSGTWTETTRGATGSLTGVVHGGTIQGTITGVGFTAALTLVTRGRTQFVSIRLNSSEIAGVTVSFHRR
jgi:hypothetical protein